MEGKIARSARIPNPKDGPPALELQLFGCNRVAQESACAQFSGRWNCRAALAGLRRPGYVDDRPL
jgi:hypothetical protein